MNTHLKRHELKSNSRYVDENEKTIEWGIGLMNSIAQFVGQSDGSWDSFWQKSVNNFNRYNGVVDEQRVKYLIEPYGVRIPTPYNRFPLGRNRIDQVISEFLLTPPRRHVMCVDKDSLDKKEEMRIKMHIRQITADIDKEIEQMIGAPIEGNESIPLVDNVNEFFEKGNYKELYAKQINKGIDYLHNVRNITERISLGLKSLFLTNRVFFEITEEDGDPMPVFIDPRSCAYELGGTSDYLDECGWFYYEKWCTISEIKNEFRDCPEFAGKEGKELLKTLEAMGGQGQGLNVNMIAGTQLGAWYKNTPETGKVVKVAKLFWQSSRQEAMKKTTVKGREAVVSISPKQRVKSNEEKMIKNVDDPWTISCIGGCIYLKFERTPNYWRDVDNPGKNPIPIVGYHGGHSSGYTVSMQDLMNPIEDMYDEVMFHYRMALSRAGGKALLYDVSQMPKAFGKNIQKVAHHMKNDGIIAVDLSKISVENPSMFNQWKEIDLSLSQGVQQLFNMKLMLEQMADDVSGVNDNRRGQIQQYETATNSNQSIARSATRTEIYMYPFNQLLKRMYEKLGNAMKHTWENGKSLAYWNPDGAQILMKVMPEIGMHNYGFYIGSPLKNNEVKAKIEGLMQALSTNAQDPTLLLSFVKIMKADYADEAESIFEKAIETMQQMQQQQQEQMAAAEEQKAQAMQQATEAENKRHQEEMQNKIDVANINAGRAITVAEMLTDNVEIKERAGIVKDAMKAQDKDGAGKDSTAESAAKNKQKRSIVNNLIK